jgi:hypothetical protein
MSRITLLTAAALVLAAPSAAEIVDLRWELVHRGYLPPPGPYIVYSYDVLVCIEGDDAWTVAGGAEVGEPWVNVYGSGELYQHPAGSATQPNPVFFPVYPMLEYDSFYTTHLGWPNVAAQGVAPGFAFGPMDTDTQLNADWFWTPDGEFYPGTFTIARFTVLAPPGVDPSITYADIDLLVGSLETAPIRYQAHIPIPEPGSVVLLALAGAVLLRRR